MQRLHPFMTEIETSSIYFDKAKKELIKIDLLPEETEYKFKIYNVIDYSEWKLEKYERRISIIESKEQYNQQVIRDQKFDSKFWNKWSYLRINSIFFDQETFKKIKSFLG